MSTPSVNMRAALKEAKRVDAALKSTDPRFRGSVRIADDEGCIFVLRWAFAVRWKNYWLVFAEHHASMVFNAGEVQSVEVLKEVQRGKHP